MKKYILPLLSIALLGMVSCNEEAATVESTATDVVNTATEVKNDVVNATENMAEEVINAVPATPQAVIATTTIKMNKMEHDFGTITDSNPVNTTFTITNTGNNPLIISSAKGSCGCTVPTYPQAPIAPGETGEIEVSFNPTGAGAQNKTVTLIANTTPANTILNIKSVINKIEQK